MSQIVVSEFHGDFDIELEDDHGRFLERLGTFYGDRTRAERVARLLNDPLIALVSVEDIHKAIIAQNLC